MRTDSGRMLFQPSWDVSEDNTSLSISVEVPGMDKEDIHVDVHGDVLTISGEKRQEDREEGDDHKWHRVERCYGSFSRSIKLPSTANLEQVSAQYEQGVLNITVPKEEPRANKRRVVVS
eukprot:CAMPEP_0115022788 /NCGR_PEP_ID=MMETSP0216-20121206/31822_1 /TAXON_ID=223996 /ORGANISM="Protocruzia adherens, Strain Boccale" /LENGTH=118 /DNA_ID=CAMNT_0002395665 /DNA_START=15 /DNA_END=371 /DNA_ORIENTATION=+